MALRPNQPHPLARKYPRATGFCVLLIGLTIFHFSIIEPILHAKVGEVIKLSGKGGIGGGAFIIFGLVLMLLGPRFMTWGQSSAANSPKLALIMGGFFAVIGIISLELTKSYLRSKGYVL
jgi:hypothetical protein